MANSQFSYSGDWTFLNRLSPLLMPVRHPLGAVICGILVPLIATPKYGLMYVGGFGTFFLHPAPESWFTWSLNPLLLYQHLFLIASSATLVGWLVTKSKHPFFVASLTGYTIVALALGFITMPLTLLLTVMRPGSEKWLPAVALVTPWLAAASFGACALEAHGIYGRTKVTSSCGPT